MVDEMLPIERIQKSIYLIRGQKVMLDRDLAALYSVPTKALKQAVKRNLSRFPGDFTFVLTSEELANWRSQFVTSNSDRMGLRYSPMVFTEKGVAMLSSVLNSEQYCNHAGLCAVARMAIIPCRPCPKTGRLGEEVRQPVQIGL